MRTVATEERSPALEALQQGDEALGGGDPELAFEAYSECVRLASGSEPGLAAIARGNRGIILWMRERYPEALAEFDAAIGALVVPGRQPGTAGLQFIRQRSDVYQDLAQYEAAFDGYARAIELARELHTAPDAGSSPQAAAIAQRALLEEAYALNSVGALRLKLHEPEAAEAVLKNAIHILEVHGGMDPVGLVAAYINHSQALRELGDTQAALHDLEEARTLAVDRNDRREVARIDALAAHLHLLRGNRALGLALVEDGIAFSEAVGEQGTALNRRTMVAQQLLGLSPPDVAAAADQIDQARRLVRPEGSPLFLAQFFNTAANVASRRGDAEGELGDLRQSWTLWARVIEGQLGPEVRATVATESLDIVQRLVVAQLRRGEVAAALDVWEAGRAAGLRARLGGGTDNGQGPGSCPAAALMGLVARPAASSELIDWVKRRSQHRRTAVAAILYAADAFHAIVITSEGELISRQAPAPADAYIKAVEDFHEALPAEGDSPMPYALEGIAHGIDAFIRPLLADVGKTVDHLVVMPTFALWNIPWSAMLADLKVPVSIALSGTWLVRQPEAPATYADVPFATIGCGTAGSIDLAAESRQVAGLTSAKLVVDGEATTEALADLLSEAGAVHVSAHGLWKQEAPNLSSIALSDGDLTVERILSLRVRAPLVILSACDGGRSHVAPNDDVMGLAAALLAAGAQAVVSALWPVDATAAATFVAALVKALREGKDAIEAAREARLATQKAFDEWKDWGAFEVFGV